MLMGEVLLVEGSGFIFFYVFLDICTRELCVCSKVDNTLLHMT